MIKQNGLYKIIHQFFYTARLFLRIADEYFRLLLSYYLVLKRYVNDCENYASSNLYKTK